MSLVEDESATLGVTYATSGTAPNHESAEYWLERMRTETYPPAADGILRAAFHDGRANNHEVIIQVLHFAYPRRETTHPLGTALRGRARQIFFGRFLKRDDGRPCRALPPWHCAWMESVASEEAHTTYGVGRCLTLYKDICSYLVHLAKANDLSKEELKVAADFATDSLLHGNWEDSVHTLATTRFASMVNSAMPDLCYLLLYAEQADVIWRSINEQYDVLGVTRWTAIREALTELACERAGRERQTPSIMRAFKYPKGRSLVARRAAETLVPELVRRCELSLRDCRRET